MKRLIVSLLIVTISIFILFGLGGCSQSADPSTNDPHDDSKGSVSISLVANGGEAVESPIILTPGTPISPEEWVNRDGYTFGGWFTDEALTVPFTDTVAPNYGITIYAWWEEENKPCDFEYEIGNIDVTILKYSADDPTVTVPEYIQGLPVTSVKKEAFAANETLESATLPPQLKKLGEKAFYNCKNLKSVSVPDAPIVFSDSAFLRCFSLDTVNIRNIDSWLRSYFSDAEANPLCNNAYLYMNGKPVTEVTVPEDITEINNYLFYHCLSLENVVVHEKIEKIGREAFQGCSNFTTHEYGNAYYLGTEENPYFFLYNAKNIPSATSITVHNATVHILDNAFYEHIWLNSVTIPPSVETIGKMAFTRCTHLSEVNLSDNLTHMGESAFLGCPNLKSIVLPDSLTVISYQAFKGCTALESVTLGKNTVSIYGVAFSGCSSLKEIGLPSTLTGIGYKAFYECSALTDITLPEGIKTIGDSAFYGCKKIKELKIPKLVEYIGSKAFKSCGGITSLHLGNSINYIGYMAFYNTALTELIIEDTPDTEIYNINSFEYCLKLKTVSVPAKFCHIIYCAPLEQLTITGSGRITGIKDCPYLKSVTLGEGITHIGDGTFSNCPMLESVIFPSSIEYIAPSAFYQSSLLSGTSYRGAQYIGGSNNPYLFLLRATDTEMTELSIHPSTQIIGNEAFMRLPKLTEAVIPEGIKEIGIKLFYECASLQSVEIKGELEVTDMMFFCCTELKVLKLGNVKAIGKSPFWQCTKLSDIYFAGSSSTLERRFANYTANAVPISCTVHCSDKDVSITL